MKKIKIIGGRYGYISPNGAFFVKTDNSAPFEVDDKEADRLIKRGVAEIVGGSGKHPEIDDETSRTGSNPTDEENAAGSENEDVFEYDENTSVKELREIGKKCGLSFPVGVTKANMIAALDEYFERDDESGVDLGVEPPVV